MDNYGGDGGNFDDNDDTNDKKHTNTIQIEKREGEPGNVVVSGAAREIKSGYNL